MSQSTLSPTVEGVNKLIALSRDLSNRNPSEASLVAKQAYEVSQGIADTSLQIEAAMNLIGKLSRNFEWGERDEMLAEWKKKIEALGNQTQKAQFHNTLAVMHLERSEFMEGLAALEPTIIHAAEVTDRKLLTMCQINYGNCYSGMGITDRAVKWFYVALESADALNDNGLRGYIHNNLGILQRTLLEIDRAIEHFDEVARLTLMSGDEATLAKAYNNLCGAYFHKGKFDLAMKYILQAQEIYIRIDDKAGIYSALTNIGMIFLRLDEFQSALDHFEEALALASILENKHAVANLIKNVADIHVEQNEYEKARPLYERSLAIASDVGGLDMLHDLHKDMAVFHSKLGEWKEAYEHQRKFTEVKAELFQGEQRNKMEELRVRFETERKEREMEQIREQNIQLEAEIEERTRVESELKRALNEIKTLSGLLPVCAHCKKIRDEQGTWLQIENYIAHRTDATFSHGICPECMEQNYPIDSE